MSLLPGRTRLTTIRSKSSAHLSFASKAGLAVDSIDLNSSLIWEANFKYGSAEDELHLKDAIKRLP
jgi:hypothetical protein